MEKVCKKMNKIAIIENSEGLGIYFTKYLEPKEYEIFPVWKTSQLPQDDFASYIFTGDFNNISDGLLPIHKAEVEFVKSIDNKKIFGSCFFHQLMGQIFGGTVRKRETRFIGWYKMTIRNNHKILNGLNDPFFLNLNVDEIVQKPNNAKILATHQDCKFQILQYGENIITSQNHPEIWLDEGLELIEKHKTGLVNSCPEMDNIVKQTKKFADDKANVIFLSNLTNWLLS